MAKYRVLSKSYIDGSIVDEGDIIEYDGEASGNLELIKPEAKANGGKKGAAQPVAPEGSDQA
jgi:signal peptidase I